MYQKFLNILFIASFAIATLPVNIFAADKNYEPQPLSPSLAPNNPDELVKTSPTNADLVKNFFEHSQYENFKQHPDTPLFDKNYLAPSSMKNRFSGVIPIKKRREDHYEY
jgi:hypothetical protein